MLIREKIATRADIEKMIEKVGFLGNDEDYVRHALKEAYKPAIMDKMKAPATAEGKHEAMRRITKELDSSDKGNLTEDWYREVELGGKGDQHVSARKDTLKEDWSVDLEKNRYIDVVEGSLGREIKSGEGKLSDGDVMQMRDYGRMVDGGVEFLTSTGKHPLKEVRFTFTSPAGAKANVATMRTALTQKPTAGNVSFELYGLDGKKVGPIKTEADLDAQKWLFE
jgi:hypothetical protein